MELLLLCSRSPVYVKYLSSIILNIYRTSTEHLPDIYWTYIGQIYLFLLFYPQKMNLLVDFVDTLDNFFKPNASPQGQLRQGLISLSTRIRGPMKLCYLAH